MQRIGIELICICDLHEISKIKHPDLITDLLDHLQLMADEQIGQPVFFLKILKHLDDLGLQGNIQCRNGLITDYKFRLYGKCSCNGNPLTLSAGKLMRILQKILLFKANHADQFFCTLLTFFLRVHFMDCHRLTDDILHCMAWVQRGIGILKNGLHFFAVWKQFFFTHGSDLCSFIKNLTACGFMIT